MSRYKGRASPKENEAKFPHHIDMMVPESGFGSRLNAMHDWFDARSIEAVRGQSRHENGRYTFAGALLIQKWRRYLERIFAER
jgi:hypothetical protein